MFTLSNILSFARIPLAFLFLFTNVKIRIIAILFAMFTDSIDGYLARKSNSASRFGAILDPVCDKFFVYLVMAILYSEANLKLWQVVMLILRDISLLIFGIYLTFAKGWSHVQFRAIKWGKITTATQFLILIPVTLKFPLPSYLYLIFIVFALMALKELFCKNVQKEEKPL